MLQPPSPPPITVGKFELLDQSQKFGKKDYDFFFSWII